MSTNLLLEQTEEFTRLASLSDPNDPDRADPEEPSMGARSNFVATELTGELIIFNKPKQIGLVIASECPYRCFPHKPLQTRRPDLSFIRTERLTKAAIPRGEMRIPPDLAVEVVSPNDPAEYLQDKLNDYLRVGVPLVWFIYPESRVAVVYRQDGTANRLTEDQFLDGETVIPGFRLRLGEILPPPAPDAE